MESIRRRDVTALLDTIDRRSGPVAADKMLAILSKLFNWWATREDSFASPIVRGMTRTSPRARARTRVLDDEEIRIVWKVAQETPIFGAFLQIALLTGQRRTKIATMRWEQIMQSGEWTIPAAAREKGNGRKLQLPPLAIDILRNQPREAGNPFVFPGRTRNGQPTAIRGYSDLKERFDPATRSTPLRANGSPSMQTAASSWMPNMAAPNSWAPPSRPCALARRLDTAATKAETLATSLSAEVFGDHGATRSTPTPEQEATP